MDVFYSEGGGVVAPFVLSYNGEVPLREIARRFGLWPETAWIWGCNYKGNLHIDKLRSETKRDGSRSQPFQIGGYYGPFSAGHTGRFICTGGGDVINMQLQKLLHLSPSIAVYSAINLATGEHLVLKLDYEADMNLEFKLGIEASAMAALAHRGIRSASLPVLVSDGRFRPWGPVSQQNFGGQFGDVHGLVTKPLGICIREMKFHGRVLCKLAFDIFLGLYHLYLIGCRHKDVCPRNMILLGKDQFALIDLEFACPEDEENLLGIVPVHGGRSDSLSLTFSLVELSQDHTSSWTTETVIKLLEAEDRTLGEFAAYVSRLDGDVWPDFKPWLYRLGRLCGLSDARIEELVAGRVSSTEFGPPPVEVTPKREQEQPWNDGPVVVWIKFMQQVGVFARTGGAFFPLESVKAKWELEGVEVAGRALGAEQDLVEVLAWSGHKGTADDPLEITGRPLLIVGHSGKQQPVRQGNKEAVGA